MSGVGRAIFERTYNATRRKFRSWEGASGGVIENWRVVRRFLLYAGSAYCTGALFKHFILENGAAEGNSMYPTMSERTPLTLTSKLHAKGKDMAVGDLVNFTTPIFQGQLAGKRIIGMPGDYIVNDPNQAPSVGGSHVPGITDWRSQREITDEVELRPREEPTMIRVPEGHVYVTGDNMSYSRDSRFYGAVPMALINGKQIMHGGFREGWHWTTGDQLRRIPKDQEEDYLRGLRTQKVEQKKAAEREGSTSQGNKVA